MPKLTSPKISFTFSVPHNANNLSTHAKTKNPTADIAKLFCICYNSRSQIKRIHTVSKDPSGSHPLGSSFCPLQQGRLGWLPLIIAIQPFADDATHNTRHNSDYKTVKRIHNNKPPSRKELRLQAQMTQQQLADLVYVSSRTIISLEKGQYNPSLMLAYRLAQVFGVSVEELYCLAENKALADQKYENLSQK